MDIRIAFKKGFDISIGDQIGFTILNERVTGDDVLINNVLSNILTIPGSDCFDLEKGSDIPTLLSRSGRDLGDLQIQVQDIFRDVTRRMVAKQNDLSKYVKLEAIELESIRNSGGATVIEFSIITDEGNKIKYNLSGEVTA